MADVRCQDIGDSLLVRWSEQYGGCSGVPGISDGFFVASGGIDAELSDLTRWPTSRPTNCIGPAGHRPAAHPVDGQPRRAPRRAVHLLRAAHRWDCLLYTSPSPRDGL